MNPFYDYLSQQIGLHLHKRRVVTWYDPDAEFQPYVDVLRASAETEGEIPRVTVENLPTHLIQYDGSFFKVRIDAEPLVSVDAPEPLLIYVPGVARDVKGSVLMELEKAGACFEWKLKGMARFCLRQTMTDGVIDDLLTPERVTYHDVVQFLEQGGGGETASMLKVIFGASKDAVALLSAWLADPSQDEAIVEKDAVTELFKLIETRLGFALSEGMALADARRKTIQSVLINEFRADLKSAPPVSIGMIAAPPLKEHGERIGLVAETLRADYEDAYIDLANSVELGLNLSGVTLTADDLGAVDTFQFEEKIFLDHCADAIANRDYDRAITVVTEHSRSFWADHDVVRQAQWEACRLMAELGQCATAILLEIDGMKPDADAWAKA